MSKFGLIGYPLLHSFSKTYFTKKFDDLALQDFTYNLFELKSLDSIREWSIKKNLSGFNVTLPYKEQIIPYLDRLDKSAKEVGAVNVVLCRNHQLVGFNTDMMAFSTSLQQWLSPFSFQGKALVLGTGGASKAVKVALYQLRIPYLLVSRTKGEDNITYDELMQRSELMSEYRLVINTTPLGTHPHTDDYPKISFKRLDSNYFIYDLVYNPAETTLMKKGREQCVQVKNGLEMLHLQAEMAWDIWTTQA